MRIAIGCDHRGLDVKQAVIGCVSQGGYGYNDLGCYTADPVDYPDIAGKVAAGVVSGEFDRGILICGTGIGMAIAANKVRGIRAALCHDAFSASRARQHNDANVLCLAGGRGEEYLCEIIDAFLNTGFEGGRHQRRLDKIRVMEG